MRSRYAILVPFLVVVLFALMAGCSSTPAGTPTPTPTPAATATVTTIPTGTTVVSTTIATPTATTMPSGGGQTVQLALTAKNIAFDKSTLTVPAGANVVLTFDNQDSGIAHNFALYTDSSATTRLFAGTFVTGPKTVTYTFTAPTTPGTYFFRCDVHPTIMYGSFIVT